MYSNKIIEIFKNPTNAGGLQGANGIGKYIDEECGDFVKIYLKISENEEIIEARFKTMGTTASIVASSVICKLANGLTISEAEKLNVNDILEYLGEFPNSKLYTLDFAVKGLNLAIENYFEKQEKEAKKLGKEFVRKTPVLEEENEDIDIETLEVAKVEKLEENEEKPAENTQISKEELRARIEAIFSKKEASESIEQEDNFEDDFDDFLEDEEIIEESAKEEPVKEEQQMQNNVSAKENEETVEELLNEDIEESNKATKLIEEAKNYTPIVETKIVKDSELKKFDNTKNTKDTSKQVSSAKAIFDSMFEE